MRKIVSATLFLTLALAGGALAALPPAGDKPAQVMNPHGASGAQPVTSFGIVDVIKGATLPMYKGMKIGEAFERYSHFKVKKWRDARGAGGAFYVDFCGSNPTSWFDFKSRRAGVSEKGIVVKFVVYPNGEYGVVMASKTVLTRDGKSTIAPLPDVKSVVDAIYNNRKLDL